MSLNSLNLQEINQEQALNLLTFFIRSNKNITLFGRAGTGKTEMALQAVQACNLKLSYINLSVVDRSDIMGYPSIHEQGDVITFKSPHYLPKLLENQQPDTVILFDEVDKCAPEITAPLLEILQFRKINGVPINAHACILTGNLPNERTYNNTISSAILDRSAKYILNFDFEQWLDWAKVNNVHDLILGFLKSDPSFTIGKEEYETTYASPSPRGWTLASQALISAKENKIVDIDSITQIISGYVGNEAGMRFSTWYCYWKQYEPYVHSLIERGNMSFNFADLMPTEKVVFVIAACYHAKQKVFSDKSKNRFIYLERLCDFFNDYKVDTEVQVIGLHTSFNFDQIKTQKLYQCKVFFDHFTKLSEGISFRK